MHGIEGEAARGSTEFVVLRGRNVGPCFTYLLARSDSFRGHAIASMSGASGRQRIRNECFSNYEMLAPPTDLGRRFESAVEPMFRAAFALSRSAQALAAIRDMLLPKLVSGQIDVSKLDLDALMGSVA